MFGGQNLVRAGKAGGPHYPATPDPEGAPHKSQLLVWVNKIAVPLPRAKQNPPSPAGSRSLKRDEISSSRGSTDTDIPDNPADNTDNIRCAYPYSLSPILFLNGLQNTGASPLSA